MKNINSGDTLSFLLYRLLNVNAVLDKNGHLLSFTQRIGSFEELYRWQVNHVLINTDKLIIMNHTAEITIDFEGYLVGYTETGISYLKDHIHTEYTILRPDFLLTLFRVALAGKKQGPCCERNLTIPFMLQYPSALLWLMVISLSKVNKLIALYSTHIRT